MTGRRLPPPNQRRLNAKIREVFGGEYADWYAIATEMQDSGGRYEDIAGLFKDLGVQISVPTIHKWLKNREREHVAA